MQVYYHFEVSVKVYRAAGLPVTIPIPSSFRNLVASTLDWGMYCCLVLNFHRGEMDQWPPLLASRILSGRYNFQSACVPFKSSMLERKTVSHLAKMEGESK